MAVTNFDQVVTSTPFPASQIAANAITTAKLAAALQLMQRQVTMATIATTGAQEVLFIAPYTGVLSAAAFAGKDALAANDTNYVTWTVVNKSNANAAMLAATAPNTTQATGGAATVAYTRRALTLNATPANLNVTLGDVIAFVITATGTLANTITEPVAALTFTPS